MWKVEYTDQFEDWWLTLSEQEQEAVTAAVEALEDRGPGDKTGQWESWYEEMVPIADRLYDEHLRAIEKEGAKE
jgi:hypothetical protein